MSRRALGLLLGALASSLLALLPAVRAEAATVSWTGLGATPNWSNPLNWSGGTVPTTGDTVSFGGTSSATTLDDLPNLSLSEIVFGSGSYTIDAATSVGLTLTGPMGVELLGNVHGGDTDTLALPLTLSNSTTVLAIQYAGDSLVLQQQVTANSIEYCGAGGFTLQETAAYSGVTGVEDPSFCLAPYANAAPFAVAENTSALGQGIVHLFPGGDLTLAAPDGSTWANTFVGHGTRSSGYGELTTYPLNASGPVTQTISGELDGGIVDLGAGAGFTASPWAADLVVTGGLGSGALMVTVPLGGGTGVLRVDGPADTVNPPSSIDIDAPATMRIETPAGTLASAAPSYWVAGTLDLSAAGQILDSASVSVQGGSINASGQAFHDLTMDGGTVTGAVITGSLSATAGAQLDGATFAGASPQVSVYQPVGATTPPKLTLNGLTSASPWTASGTGTIVLTGSVPSGAPMTVTGGSMTLQLEPCGCGSVDMPVVVENGATLTGSGGGAMAVDVEAGGYLRPQGTLTVGSLTMGYGTTFEELSDATRTWGEVVSSGSVALEYATADLYAASAPPAGSVSTLIHTTSGQGVIGSFAGVPEYGDVLLYSQTQSGWSILYDDHGGADVTATYHPYSPDLGVEPSSWTTLTYTPGESLTFSVDLTPATTYQSPPPVTGQVIAWDGYAPLPGIAPVTLTNGVATVSITLRSWPHQIWFLYTGDANWMPAASYETLFVPSTMPSGGVGQAGEPAGPAIRVSPSAPSRSVARAEPVPARGMQSPGTIGGPAAVPVPETHRHQVPPAPTHERPSVSAGVTFDAAPVGAEWRWQAPALPVGALVLLVGVARFRRRRRAAVD